MKLSENGIKFLKDREGYREVAYRDEGGVWTIGYGTTWINNKRVTRDDICDKFLAENWMMDDIVETEVVINERVKIKINQNQYDSLVSLVYNIGIDGFKHSSLLKTLNKNAGIYADLFLRWCKITLPNGKKVTSQGLLNRRKLEYELFIKD